MTQSALAFSRIQHLKLTLDRLGHLLAAWDQWLWGQEVEGELESLKLFKKGEEFFTAFWLVGDDTQYFVSEKDLGTSFGFVVGDRVRIFPWGCFPDDPSCVVVRPVVVEA
jgi:hypothetical protein